MRLGNNLRRLRFEANELSQQGLADRVGVTRQTIISIEKGRFKPSALLALQFASTFNTTVENVFFIIPDEEQPDERA